MSLILRKVARACYCLLAPVTGTILGCSSPATRTTPAPGSASGASAIAPGLTALRFGALVDGDGRTTPNAVVIVSGERIVSVGSNAAIPAGARVVDLRRYTAIPGLIDAHTHLTYVAEPGRGEAPASGDPWAAQGRRLSAVTVFLAQENARRTLETGVTTVRDLGASEYGDIALRTLIARGSVVGPRVFASGFGLQKARTAPRPGAPPGAPRGRILDTADIAVAVKAQVDAGADQIKVYGSTGSAADVTGRQTFTFEEMAAIVRAAERLGRRVAIHSYGPEGGRDAVRAGAASLEHAIDLDEATLAEMRRRGTVYVPTIDHNRYYADARAYFGYSAAQVAALDSFRLRNTESARRAHRAGVTFAMGSDAVFTMFGQNTRELAWFVEIGMTPAQALATATVNGARLLGREQELGRVAPGYLADIVAVEGNPLTDIRAITERVRWVMKGGTVVVHRER